MHKVRRTYKKLKVLDVRLKDTCTWTEENTTKTTTRKTDSYVSRKNATSDSLTKAYIHGTIEYKTGPSVEDSPLGPF